jgi:hypothetical protein
MPSSVITPHDPRAELVSRAVHSASPEHRRGSQVRVLTRRGWRSVSHLNELAQSCRDRGVDVTSAFRFLGLA